MGDTQYQTFPAFFASKGIAARYVSDRLPPEFYLNLDNVEELAEVSFSSRPGSIIINRTGSVVEPVGGSVESLGRLAGFNATWRYAFSSIGQIYRRQGDFQGPYTSIFSGLSRAQVSTAVYRPEQSSYPYIFIADSKAMLKDNGSFTAPQQWGITPPSVPVQNPTVQPPQTVLVDRLDGTTTPTFAGDISFTYPEGPFTSSLTNAFAAGLQTAIPASMTLGGGYTISPYQFLKVGTEYVLVISTTATSFTAFFTLPHSIGDTVSIAFASMAVAASTTATITLNQTQDLSVFPNGIRVQEADYIGIAIQPNSPNNISQINLLFDVGDGSFTEDYFMATFQPNIYQGVISGTETSTEAAFANTFAESMGLTTQGIGNPNFLDTGQAVWNYFLVQLSAFTGVGRADFNDPTYNWSNVKGYQIQVITNTNGETQVTFANIFLMGGYGPDSFAGVGYDWLYTYYNSVTGAESNPCVETLDTVPTEGSGYIPSRYPFPRRQPVLLTLTRSTDPQVTNIRIYRRGGTLGENYLRVDQIPATSTTYLDISADADIEGSDEVSLVNDVPVTSTLPVPANTTFTANITPTGNGSFEIITPASMANIFINQQVTLGSISDPNQEVVIVFAASSASFTAWVQNPHLAGDPITAEAFYGQPCNLCAVAYNAMWLAGDPNNPHFLYYSTNFSPESFGSANFIEVGIPDDPIMAIIPFQGSLYVATKRTWYAIAPGTQGGPPTAYSTAAEHGIVAAHGWVATESEIFFQAFDGIRTFAGSADMYRSLDIEFLFQQTEGFTPIVAFNPTGLALTVMEYFDNVVYIGYIATDNLRHRICYDKRYNRWRNNDTPANCMLVEADTNTLLFGDVGGLIHQDRIETYDEVNVGGSLGKSPIAWNLQTAYQDQGMSKNLKNYQELTLDADTAGQTLSLALLFDDASVTIPIGTLKTTTRQKVNFNINAGIGQTNYRVSLQITGNTLAQATVYQVDIRAIPLAETRQSWDTYWLRLGTDESKLLKNVYIEYNSSTTLSFICYYDQEAIPGFSFTLPPSTQRISTRVRMPAVKFRLFRMICISTADFQIWPESKMDVKAIVSGKGWMSMQFSP